MPASPMPTARVVSVATALPGPPIDNAALGRFFGTGRVFEQWVNEFIGTRTRHLAVDLETGQIRAGLADLAEDAGRRALAGVGVGPDEVDLVLLATSMPDSLLPTSVNLVADRLGINGVRTYQLQSGCTGAVQALDLAHQAIQAGRARTVLVLGGDVCAKHVDLEADFAALEPGELVNTVLFGDGAGALVLSAEDGPALRDASAARTAPVLRHVHTRFVGLGRPPGQTVEWFGLGDRRSDHRAIHEDFKAIEENVPALAAEALGDALDAVGWKDTDVDVLMPPQLSVRMTDRIVAHLDLPGARRVDCVGDTGNTANALAFFQLELALPGLEPGQRAVGVAVESSKWIEAAFVLEREGDR
ncbi:3-oxoacyl-ACP synthase III family protein [Streptomyces sp. NPDC056161]|uniref:3-oxoacyl-ACP synthase III family protein n=1 Tax=Streptomyces sp. NPDC056161 TaxID=3345732 RepID=UPI0035D5509B